MTLLPITKRTTYCIKDCGKKICSCKPSQRTQALTQANCEPIEVQQGIYDIAPEREEITDQEELNQPWPQLKMNV